MTRLLNPLVAIQESSGVALTIPAGARVKCEAAQVVPGVVDLRWKGETYFASLADMLDASSVPFIDAWCLLSPGTNMDAAWCPWITDVKPPSRAQTAKTFVVPAIEFRPTFRRRLRSA